MSNLEGIAARSTLGGAGLFLVYYALQGITVGLDIINVNPNVQGPGITGEDMERVGGYEYPTRVDENDVQLHTSLGNIARADQLEFANKLLLQWGTIGAVGVFGTSVAIFKK